MLVNALHQASGSSSDGRSEPEDSDYVTVTRRPHLTGKKATGTHTSGFAPDTIGAQGGHQRLRERRHRYRLLCRHVDMLSQAGAQALMMGNQGGRRRVG